MRAVMALLFEQLAHHAADSGGDTRKPERSNSWKGWAFVAGRITGRISFFKASGAMSTCTRCCAANISEVVGEPSLARRTISYAGG